MIAVTPSSMQDPTLVQMQPFSPNPRIWSTLAALSVDPVEMERQRVVSFQRRDPAALAFDIMRTKLLQSAGEQHWTSVGITAPTAGCGKATVAANLAMSLSKHENIRVAVIDLDLRRPRLASIFAHNGRYTTAEFLRGECLVEDFFVRLGENLAIGASPDAMDYPAELLHSPSAATLLGRAREELRADITIYNLPALLEGDDCLGLLPLMEATLLVVGAEESLIPDIDASERELHNRTNLLGVVLNKCRYKNPQNTNFQA